jgi:hypothetical protein
MSLFELTGGGVDFSLSVLAAIPSALCSYESVATKAGANRLCVSAGAGRNRSSW